MTQTNDNVLFTGRRQKFNLEIARRKRGRTQIILPMKCGHCAALFSHTSFLFLFPRYTLYKMNTICEQILKPKQSVETLFSDRSVSQKASQIDS